MNNSLYIIYVLFLYFTSLCHANRQLSITLNPDCGDLCTGKTTNINVIYVTAVGSDDTVHYLWSTEGTFSMFMAKTALDAQLQFDWNKFLGNNISDSIKFSVEPNETAAVIFTRLYEYDDINDVVDVTKLSKDSTIYTHHTEDFNWFNVSSSKSSSDRVNAAFSITSDGVRNQTLQLYLNAFGSEGNVDQLPSLKHLAESFQFEIVLDHFLTNFTQTRFAVEFLVFNSKGDGFSTKKQKSIDDEYTPGVFITYTLNSPKNGGSYCQWKPVCYTSGDRTTEYSTDSIQAAEPNLSVSNRTEEVYSSLAYAYYGENVTHMLGGWLNVSFGLQEDKFYEKTNFLTWTAVIGIGNPPEEKFSSLVIIVIIVGFGVPALLIMAGGIFIAVRRCRRNVPDDDDDDKLCGEDE